MSVTDVDRAAPHNANVVSTVAFQHGDTTLHTPAIDIDCEHWYVQSSTPGHAHLFFNKKVSPEQYRKLLTALQECGIIGSGNVHQFDRDGGCSFRLPGVQKGNEYGQQDSSTGNGFIDLPSPKPWI